MQHGIFKISNNEENVINPASLKYATLHQNVIFRSKCDIVASIPGVDNKTP